jgi:hypothetical protein
MRVIERQKEEGREGRWKERDTELNETRERKREWCCVCIQKKVLYRRRAREKGDGGVKMKARRTIHEFFFFFLLYHFFFLKNQIKSIF